MRTRIPPGDCAECDTPNRLHWSQDGKFRLPCWRAVQPLKQNDAQHCCMCRKRIEPEHTVLEVKHGRAHTWCVFPNEGKAA